MFDFLLRLVRGGSWINTATECQTAFRGCCDADLLGSDFGFRVVCISHGNHTIQLKEQTDDWTIYFRLIRGGSWDNRSSDCRSACRGVGLPGLASSDAGFRMVCLHQDNDHTIHLNGNDDIP